MESLERAAASSSYLTVGRGKKFVTSQKAFQAAKIQHFVKMSNETCHLSCRHWHLQPVNPARPPREPARQPGNASVSASHTHKYSHTDTDTLCGWECIYPVRSLICFNKRYTFSKYVYAAHEEHDKQPTHAVPELPLGISFSR